ncbi:MAG: DegV family protein [Ilumatobacter sp.]|uniref:DegV family protein n=1 Tax=Ilumatobacter sp. TaxID=1967498 RepID=UPI00260BA287|nr:DegV family protein [Ilumatobacter sp.]MDJ0770263.1 DegV family protein [Ilumatobacter sp.]
MTPTIGVVTDSNSQITRDLVERYGVEVVPMTVTIDGIDYAEGVDLDADGFYEHFSEGVRPEVSTSQPPPGAFIDAYQRLIERGCDEIVSIHIAEAMSGTIGSATLAAEAVSAPVHVVDTGSASYGVSVCVWAAGAVLASGGRPDDVRRRIADLMPRIGTAFMVGVPHLTERGGRAADVELDGDGIPVLAMCDGSLEVLERVSTVEDTVDVMAGYVAGWGERVTAAIGTADEPSRRLTEMLGAALAAAANVDDVVHYRVGPSVGAHTGPGTFGLFVFPTI